MFRFPANITRFQRRNRSQRQLPFPAAPNLRVAQLTVPGAAFDSIRSFPRDCWDELEEYRPHVLVGSTADLQRVAELARRNVLDLTSVDRALFALTCCGDQPLRDVSRVVLWQAFGVPVYELFIGAGGALLASECQAQEGWHVESGARFSLMNRELVVRTRDRIETPTGLTARLESKLCPCGRAGMRIIDVEPLALIRVRRALAAIA